MLRLTFTPFVSSLPQIFTTRQMKITPPVFKLVIRSSNQKTPLTLLIRSFSSSQRSVDGTSSRSFSDAPPLSDLPLSLKVTPPVVHLNYTQHLLVSKSMPLKGRSAEELQAGIKARTLSRRQTSSCASSIASTLTFPTINRSLRASTPPMTDISVSQMVPPSSTLRGEISQISTTANRFPPHPQPSLPGQ